MISFIGYGTKIAIEGESVKQKAESFISKVVAFSFGLLAFCFTL